MSVTEFVISFVFMAVATMTIIVVGTLGAADLLHRHRRSDEAEDGAEGSHRQPQTGDAKAGRDSESEAAAERNAGIVDALMPLGSSLTFVWRPKGPAAEDSEGEPEDPTHGRAA